MRNVTEISKHALHEAIAIVLHCDGHSSFVYRKYKLELISY